MAYNMQHINLTAATLTLAKSTHSATWVTVNRAAGTTITLPAATGTGAEYIVYVGTTLTGNGIIAVNGTPGTDVMDGVIALASDVAGVTCPTTATSDTVTLSGSTTGGILGTRLNFVDVASGHWAVSGWINATGTEATPFSAAVP